MNYRGFNIEPFCSDVCWDHRRPQTLSEICRNMDSCCGFRAVAVREKYPGLTLLLEHTYDPPMEIPIPELPSLGRHIYHRCVSLYDEQIFIGTHLCSSYGDSYTCISVIGSTYISQMRQLLCWVCNYWKTPMSQLWRFLYPKYRHWVDIYITDKAVSLLSIQRLEHTYAPCMEIPIPQLPSLCRHIYHRCVSLNAEHTIIGTHLCSRYEDSYTQITVIGSTYISQMRQSLCWTYNYWNTPMPQVWRFLYPNYRHCVDIYITDASVSTLSIQLLKNSYVTGMEIPIPKLPLLGRHIYISRMHQSLYWACNYWDTLMS